MLGDVLIAEFTLRTGIPTRLYRVLDDSDQAWFDYEQEAAGEHAKSTISLMRKSIWRALHEGHLVSSFILKVPHEGRWAPWNAFAILNDTASVEKVEGNRITNVIDFTLTGFDMEILHSILFWVLFELCQLEEDEDFFPRLLFELQIPSPVEEDKLEAWKASKNYRELHRRVQRWKSNPPKTRKQIESLIKDIVDRGETVLAETPSDAARYDEHVVSPLDDDAWFVDGIEWAVSFQGVEQYIVVLMLLIGDDPDDDESIRAIEPWWGIKSEGGDPREYKGDITDLLTAFIGSRILIPADQYEDWLDKHTAKPVQIFAPLDFDLEAYQLLLGSVRIPWLWDAKQAQAFFTALEEG